MRRRRFAASELGPAGAIAGARIPMTSAVEIRRACHTISHNTADQLLCHAFVGYIGGTAAFLALFRPPSGVASSGYFPRVK